MKRETQDAKSESPKIQHLSLFTFYISRRTLMKAMILAAGLGTRLKPLTNTIPKPLLPIAGTPLIVWNLLLLKRHGFRDVVINLHYLGGMIEQALGNGSRYGLRIIYSHEPVILGTGGGLKQAEPYFCGESVLVLNGDTLVDLDLGALCEFHQQREAIATLVLRKDPEAAQWGLVEMDSDNRIVRITGRGRTNKASTQAACLPGFMCFVRSSCEMCRRVWPRRSSIPMWRRFSRERQCLGMTVTDTGRTSGRRSAMRKPNWMLQPGASRLRQDSDLLR